MVSHRKSIVGGNIFNDLKNVLAMNLGGITQASPFNQIPCIKEQKLLFIRFCFEFFILTLECTELPWAEIF